MTSQLLVPDRFGFGAAGRGRHVEENYRVLFQAATPQSIDAATLGQGQSRTGKIYFDVTGADPTMVVYNDAVQDRLIWQ